MSDPIHIISLGAGVQSSCIALMAAKGEIMPMPNCAIFADTQDEPNSVYDWLNWLEKQLPFPVHRVTKGKLSEEALRMRTTKDGRAFTVTSLPYFTLSETGEKGMVPHRACTVDYKIKPILKKVRELASIKRGQKTVGAIQWIGISLDEVSRMKDSRDQWVSNRWPLIEKRMSRHDCLAWMQRNGFPKPPRSSCVFCPYHNNAEWAHLKSTDPIAFERAVAFERDKQTAKQLIDRVKSKLFLHRSCVPLDTVDFSTEEEKGQLNLFNNECEGMCGV